MDPTMALEELRSLVQRLRSRDELLDDPVYLDQVADLALDRACDLDQWLVRGGALPDQWTYYR